MKRFLSAPAVYIAWAVFVVAALIVTYPIDPFLFGMATLVLAWGTGAVGCLALVAAVLWAGEWPKARRAGIAIGVVASGAAVATALAVLSTFNWA